jgi:heme oxygenase
VTLLVSSARGVLPAADPVLPASTCPAPGAALARVRWATGARHATLDARLPIARDDAGLAEVAAHLCLLRAWLGPMAAWLARFSDGPQAAAHPSAGDRLAGLTDDLARLAGLASGHAPRTTPPADDPRPWPMTADAAYRWGVAYVVEGSALGGRVLARRFAPALGGLALHTLADDEAVSRRWRAFLDAFDAALRDETAIATACAGACDAFDHLLALAGLPAETRR